MQICQELEDSELAQLAGQLECLVVNSTRMRYPDRVCFPRIPNEVYSADMAEEALWLAKKIVQRVKNRLTEGLCNEESYSNVYCYKMTEQKIMYNKADS